jgi:uncharacterized protein YndB with AHSA1/START domain
MRLKSAVSVRVRRRLHAPPRRVFEAWLDRKLAMRWLFATAARPLARAEIDPRVSGSFRFVDRRRSDVIEYRGAYDEIVPHRRLVFTLRERDDGGASRVSVELAPARGGCALTLVHDGVAADRAADVAGRWIGMLYGLDAMLDARAEFPATKRSER